MLSVVIKKKEWKFVHMKEKDKEFIVSKKNGNLLTQRKGRKQKEFIYDIEMIRIRFSQHVLA